MNIQDPTSQPYTSSNDKNMKQLNPFGSLRKVYKFSRNNTSIESNASLLSEASISTCVDDEEIKQGEHSPTDLMSGLSISSVGEPAEEGQSSVYSFSNETSTDLRRVTSSIKSRFKIPSPWRAKTHSGESETTEPSSSSATLVNSGQERLYASSAGSSTTLGSLASTTSRLVDDPDPKRGRYVFDVELDVYELQQQSCKDAYDSLELPQHLAEDECRLTRYEYNAKAYTCALYDHYIRQILHYEELEPATGITEYGLKLLDIINEDCQLSGVGYTTG